jgi:uncharacterized protein YxjI
MDLLDKKIDTYLLQKRSWKSDCVIFNPKGEKIGIVKHKRISIKEEIQLLNLDRTVLCIINKKLIDTRSIYEVRTPTGEMIGRGKERGTIRRSVDMHDSKGNIIYKTQGGAIKSSFQIIHPDDENKIYAETKRDIKNHYVIHIVDPSESRLLLLVYAIIIYDIYRDE